MSNKLIKQLSDPIWRLDNLYRIKTKAGHTVKYQANNLQNVLLGEYDTQYVDVLKARQMGVSTHYLLEKLDDTMWNENRTTVILSHERESVEKLFRIARFAYDKMDDDIKPPLDRGGGSKFMMYFPEINSRIYVALEVRSDTVTNLHVSETALNKEPSRITASLDAVPIDGKVTRETTAFGMNHYYDERKDPNTIYKNLFFPWYIHTEYTLPVHKQSKLTPEEMVMINKAKELYGIKITKGQIEFRRFKISQKKGNVGEFLREFPEDEDTCFTESNEAPIDVLTVQKRIAKVQNLKPIIDFAGVTVFKKYNSGTRYVIGADTAEGFDGDFCAASCFDMKTREQVGHLHGRWKPHDFAKKLVEFSAHFHKPTLMPPLLAVERNNHGHAVLLELKEHLNYGNLYYEDKKNRDKPGWITDRVSRPIMVNALIDGIENETVKINHLTTLKECLTLMNNNGKIEAISGKHDDSFIATSIALQLVIQFSASSAYNNISDKILLRGSSLGY